MRADVDVSTFDSGGLLSPEETLKHGDWAAAYGQQETLDRYKQFKGVSVQNLSLIIGGLVAMK